MAEEIINALSHIKRLRVVARTSAFAFKDKQQDVREIGKKLGVGNLLEGSVRKAGRRLRITAQLISISDGYHLWSERYDRDLEDVFAIQDEISLAIVNGLKVELLGKEKAALVKRRTESIHAYELCLKGWQQLQTWTPEAEKRAIEYFELAIEQDADYALAHAGISEAYLHLLYFGGLRRLDLYPKIKEAAEKALRIDAESAEAYTTRAVARLVGDFDWTGSEQDFERAIEANPGSVSVYRWYATAYLVAAGRPGEALEATQHALELDPLAPNENIDLGWDYYFARQYDEAINQLSRTLEREPNHSGAHWVSLLAYVQKSMYGDAVAHGQEAVTHAGESPLYMANLGYAQAMAGNHEEALKIARQLEGDWNQTYASLYYIAAIYVGLSDHEGAFTCLERAFLERDSFLTLVNEDPIFDALHSDSRFNDLIRRMNFPDQP